MKIAVVWTVLSIILTVAGCTVETTMVIHDDASGSARVTVALHPVAVRYMSDISASFSDTESEPQGPFDVEMIQRSIEMNQGMELESIEIESANTLTLSVRFNDVRDLLRRETTLLFESGAQTHPLIFSTDDKERLLGLKLTRQNFHLISGLFVPPDSPVTVLLPYYEDDFMPRDEYLEVLSYALEDYLEGMPVEEFVADAGVRTTVIADDTITAVSGGKIVDGRAEFFIPLVKVLTLEEDIEYAVKW